MGRKNKSNPFAAKKRQKKENVSIFIQKDLFTLRI